MSTPWISIFGGVLEREALNTSDDFAEGVIFFGLIGHSGVHGGCVRVKQVVGSTIRDAAFEVSAPLAYKGPAFDHGLLSDVIRWYWRTTHAELLESAFGDSNIPDFVRVSLKTNFGRQVSLPFERHWFERLKAKEQ